MERLVEYALRYDVGAVIKRLGWAPVLTLFFRPNRL
jgi:hypothetical protein